MEMAWRQVGGGARRTTVGSYLAALGLVAASTVLAEIIYRIADTNRLSMVFLAGILVAGVTLGSGPAYFAAAVAFFIYNIYLVEPRFTFGFRSPEDVIVLVVFLAVAMLTGRLTGQIRDAARRAEIRAQTAAVLFEASREFSSSGAEEALRERLAQRLAEAAGGPAVIADGAARWGSQPEPNAPAALIDRARRGQAEGEPATISQDGWSARALLADGQALGVAVWRAESASDSDRERLLDVLVDLGAAAIARARLASVQAEVQALARTEKLRNALLSSISHDLRTPLTSILASATSLREFGDRFEPTVRADLAATIQEEAERLNAFVANLLNMTKLEGEGLAIDVGPFNLVEAVDRVIARLARRKGERLLTRQASQADLTALGDPILFEQALANVVENALRYSPPRSTVTVGVSPLDGMMLVEVADEGPGLPPHDLDRVFEKFYRSSASDPKLQGTGLGLSIAKGLVEAMDGSVTARLRDGGGGLIVSFILPRNT